MARFLTTWQGFDRNARTVGEGPCGWWKGIHAPTAAVEGKKLVVSERTRGKVETLRKKKMTIPRRVKIN